MKPLILIILLFLGQKMIGQLVTGKLLNESNDVVEGAKGLHCERRKCELFFYKKLITGNIHRKLIRYGMEGNAVCN